MVDPNQKPGGLAGPSNTLAYPINERRTLSPISTVSRTKHIAEAGMSNVEFFLQAALLFFVIAAVALAAIKLGS